MARGRRKEKRIVRYERYECGYGRWMGGWYMVIWDGCLVRGKKRKTK
jgi:hypothetical protein